MHLQDGIINYAKLSCAVKAGRKSMRAPDPMFRLAKQVQADPCSKVMYVNSKVAYDSVTPTPATITAQPHRNVCNSSPSLPCRQSAGGLYGSRSVGSGIAADMGTDTSSGVQILGAVSEALLQERTTIAAMLDLSTVCWKQRR